jgi:hypothetical protein
MAARELASREAPRWLSRAQAGMRDGQTGGAEAAEHVQGIGWHDARLAAVSNSMGARLLWVRVCGGGLRKQPQIFFSPNLRVGHGPPGSPCRSATAAEEALLVPDGSTSTAIAVAKSVGKAEATHKSAVTTITICDGSESV